MCMLRCRGERWRTNEHHDESKGMVGGKMNIMCWPTAKCAGKVVGEDSAFSNDIEA